jgi:DNA-binding NarL/FixJ family response regulator
VRKTEFAEGAPQECLEGCEAAPFGPDEDGGDASPVAQQERRSGLGCVGSSGVLTCRGVEPGREVVGVDVVLMDVRMPDLDGIEATRLLATSAPLVKVLILTTFEQDDYVFGALRAGASGFLLKRTRPEELIAAVHTIAAGDALLSPSVTRRVIDRMAQQPTPQYADRSAIDDLTRRERDVLDALVRGLSNREIAAALFVEESTVRTHVKRVLMKLNLRDRVQAVIYAYESGLNSSSSSPTTRP